MTRHTRLLAVITLAAWGHAVAEESRPPNVFFIIADDLGAQALGCYGNAQSQTPHIDTLAREGTRFTRAYSQYPICGPSRAALMAGRYPESLRIMGNGDSEKYEKAHGSGLYRTRTFFPLARAARRVRSSVDPNCFARSAIRAAGRA